MIIAAVDPGTTTAIAWTSRLVDLQDLHLYYDTIEFACPVPVTAPVWDVYQAELRMADEISDFLRGLNPDVLLLEDFITRIMNKSRAFLSPVRITIAILCGLRERGMGPEILFPPANAMASMSDERLKEHFLWTAGSKHKRAATKHLAVFCRGRSGATSS